MSSKDPKDDAQVRAEMLGEDGSSAAPKDTPPVEQDHNDAEDAAILAEMKAEENAKLRAEGIDPNHPILTVDEQREAIARAKARVTADSKKEAAKALEQQVYEEARGTGGLRTGKPELDELVHVTLDLAEHSDCIRINGHQFWHGHTYRVPRHVAQTMAEIQDRGHRHQADLDGKGMSEWAKKPRLTAVRANTEGNIIGIDNAPQQAA